MTSARERVFSIAIAWICGAVDPAEALAALPPDVVAEALEDADGQELAAADRRSLLQVASHDPRVRVRTLVAEQAVALLPGEGPTAERLIADLARDASERVRAAAGRGLAELLRRSAPRDRLDVLSRWTLSDHAAEREAIARALAEPAPAMLTDLAIDQLSRDSDRGVRLAALAAAAAHFDELPDVYLRVAYALVEDPDRRVREEAHRLLRRG